MKVVPRFLHVSPPPGRPAFLWGTRGTAKSTQVSTVVLYSRFATLLAAARSTSGARRTL